MVATELYLNDAQTVVTSGGLTGFPTISSGHSESWNVQSPGAFPGQTGTTVPPGQFHVADPVQPSEVILVTAVSGGTWTVTRGAEGTTPVAHTQNFIVQQVVTAGNATALLPAAQLGVFSPLAYGAYGDGVHDDTTALQNCCAAAMASQGVVYLGNYNYLTSAPIQIGPSFTMRGSGSFSTGSATGGSITNSTSDIFQVTASASSVTFEDCAFFATATPGGATISSAGNGTATYTGSAPIIGAAACFAESGTTVTGTATLSNVNGGPYIYTITSGTQFWSTGNIGPYTASGGTPTLTITGASQSGSLTGYAQLIPQGGHIWNIPAQYPQQGSSFWTMRNVWAAQSNPMYSVWNSIGQSWIDCDIGPGCFFAAAFCATAVPWLAGRPAAYNSNRFSRMRVSAPQCQVPFFQIDMGYGTRTTDSLQFTANSNQVLNLSGTAVAADVGMMIYSSNFPGSEAQITAVNVGTQYYTTAIATNSSGIISPQTCKVGWNGWGQDNIFDHVTFEVCSGGGITMKGFVDTLITMCTNWDISVAEHGITTYPVNNFFNFTESLAGYSSQTVQIRGGKSGGIYGPGATVPNSYADIYADNTIQTILIESVGLWGRPPVINTPASQTTFINPYNTSGAVVGQYPTITAPAIEASGAGPTLPNRLVGGTASGSPTLTTNPLTGQHNAYQVGDISVDATGVMWVCTAAGTPGNWVTATSVPTQINWYTTNGTYTQPVGAASIEVMLLAGGAGGGAGATGPATDVRCGGGGGGGGSYLIRSFAASDLPGTAINVQIGAGGTGGSGVSNASAGVNGQAGQNSAQTFFGTGPVYMQTYIALGGGGGTFGASSGTGTGGGTELGMATGGGGGTASTTGGAGGGPNVSPGANGGGSGGGITTGNVPNNGSNSSYSMLGSNSGSGGQGIVDVSLPTGGTVPTIKGTPGTGGGGGAASINAPSYTLTSNSPSTPSACVFTATGSAYANGATIVLSISGTLPAPFATATTYYVVGVSGTTFSLAATSNGVAIVTTTAGSGTITGTGTGAQNGANAAAYGGGGGGGGASLNPNTSGSGGNGMSGFALIITHFS